MKNNIIKYLPPFIFFLFILWMVIQANMDNKNLIMDIGNAIPWGDKIGHFTLFGMLALLLNMAIKFCQIKIHTRRFHLGSVIVFVFAIIEEFSQLAFSTRTFDLVDMLFDLLGVGILSSIAFRKFLIKGFQCVTDFLINNFYVDYKT